VLRIDVGRSSIDWHARIPVGIPALAANLHGDAIVLMSIDDPRTLDATFRVLGPAREDVLEVKGPWSDDCLRWHGEVVETMHGELGGTGPSFTRRQGATACRSQEQDAWDAAAAKGLPRSDLDIDATMRRDEASLLVGVRRLGAGSPMVLVTSLGGVVSSPQDYRELAGWLRSPTTVDPPPPELYIAHADPNRVAIRAPDEQQVDSICFARPGEGPTCTPVDQHCPPGLRGLPPDQLAWVTTKDGRASSMIVVDPTPGDG
jgi:hypothetical protein